MCICVGVGLVLGGLNGKKLHARRNGIEHLVPSTGILNDLWSIHGKMNINILFMDGNLDLRVLFFLINI